MKELVQLVEEGEMVTSSIKLENDSINFEKEIENIIRNGQRVDICAMIWQIGEKLPVNQLPHFMTLLLQAISDNGPKLVLDGNNDVSTI